MALTVYNKGGGIMGRTTGLPFSAPTKGADYQRPQAAQQQQGRQVNMSAYSPGRAQSIPSQSQGTPYGREPRRGATVGKTSPTWSSGTPVARPTSAPTPTQGRPRAQPSAPPRPYPRPTYEIPSDMGAPPPRPYPRPTYEIPSDMGAPPPRPAQGYQDKYAAGTSSEYMAANPDVLPPPSLTRPYRGPGMGGRPDLQQPWTGGGMPRPSGMGDQPWASGPPRQSNYPGYDPIYTLDTTPEYMAANPDDLSPPRPMNYSGYAPEPQPGFTSTVTGLDGSPMEPTQFYNQRDALIQLLNQQNAQYMPYSGVSRTPGPVPSAPDIGSLWGQAGDMVGQGWQNPFRMTQPQPGTPPIGAGRYYA